jgi:hypothetical protein
LDNQDLDYSSDSGFGRELADDSDFERDDNNFTTDDGSSMFSRALTDIESLSQFITSDKKSRPKSTSVQQMVIKPAKKEAKKSKALAIPSTQSKHSKAKPKKAAPKEKAVSKPAKKP